ncbi:MAG TPA: amino acid permease [Gemmatimonadaceae bacterium]|nr:amino acid permease [Gemmatimonadaceae bacterium]
MTDGLRRTLGTLDLTLLTIGLVIGSGIFIVPAVVLRSSGGSMGLALGIWVVGGILSLLGALTYGELGAMDAGSGGLYSYLRDAFGPWLAFLYGWTLLLVLATGSVATLAAAAARYFGEFVTLGPVAQKLFSVAMIAVLGVVNVLSTRKSATLQNAATAIKVSAILVMSGLLFALGSGGPPAAPAADSPSFMAGVGLAMISVLWAYEGWQYTTFAAGEALDPQRSFPRALVLGTLILIGLYVLANVAYVAALGGARVAASERVAAEAVTTVVGPTAGRLVAGAIMISMFSAALSIVITAPRVFYTMARDGLFFRKLAEVHPRFGTPAFAIVVGTLWAMVLAATGTFEQLLTYVVFIGWIFYGLGAIAVIILRHKRPDAPRPFRVPGYPVTPIVFTLAALAIVGNTIATRPRDVALGLLVVALGLPAYLIWRRKK